MKEKIRIFFAHSAGSQNGKGEGSFDLVHYLRAALGENYTLLFPLVKEAENPAYPHWKTLLGQEFKQVQGPVILVGHSLGASVLLKYLSEVPTDLELKGMFLVATPQWNPDGWNSDEWAVQKDFIAHLPPIPALYFYHCINDPIVPFKHLDFYRKTFKNAVFRELSCDDHVFADGLRELADDIRSVARMISFRF